MDLDKDVSFLKVFIRDLPWIKITTGVGKLLVLLLVLFAVVALQENIEIGPFKVTRPETTQERNCRLVAQEESMRDQDVTREILALEAQVATKDHDLFEIRQKCLTANANQNRPKNESRCRTHISGRGPGVAFWANPVGDYETELTSTAEERDDLQSKISVMEQEQAQGQQQVRKLCLGIATHEPTGKEARAP